MSVCLTTVRSRGWAGPPAGRPSALRRLRVAFRPRTRSISRHSGRGPVRVVVRKYVIPQATRTGTSPTEVTVAPAVSPPRGMPDQASESTRALTRPSIGRGTRSKRTVPMIGLRKPAPSPLTRNTTRTALMGASKARMRKPWRPGEQESGEEHRPASQPVRDRRGQHAAADRRGSRHAVHQADRCRPVAGLLGPDGNEHGPDLARLGGAVVATADSDAVTRADAAAQRCAERLDIGGVAYGHLHLRRLRVRGESRRLPGP